VNELEKLKSMMEKNNEEGPLDTERENLNRKLEFGEGEIEMGAIVENENQAVNNNLAYTNTNGELTYNPQAQVGINIQVSNAVNPNIMGGYNNLGEFNGEGGSSVPNVPNVPFNNGVQVSGQSLYGFTPQGGVGGGVSGGVSSGGGVGGGGEISISVGVGVSGGISSSVNPNNQI